MLQILFCRRGLSRTCAISAQCWHDVSPGSSAGIPATVYVLPCMIKDARLGSVLHESVVPACLAVTKTFRRHACVRATNRLREGGVTATPPCMFKVCVKVLSARACVPRLCASTLQVTG